MGLHVNFSNLVLGWLVHRPRLELLSAVHVKVLSLVSSDTPAPYREMTFTAVTLSVPQKLTLALMSHS